MPGWLNSAWETAKSWVGIDASPEVRDRDPSHEKVKVGPRIPAFLPFFEVGHTAGETAAHRLAYRTMLADGFIKAALLGKLFGVMSLDLQVHPASDSKRDQDIADFIKWNLSDRLEEGVPGMCWDILSGACIDGVSVCEKVWQLEDRGKWKGKQVLRRLKAKDVGNDVVLEIDEYRNILGIHALRYNSNEVYHPQDFLIFTHLGLYENPTGMADLRAAYRPYWFLDTVTKLRGLASEKRSLPVIAGEYPEPTKQKSLENALAQVRSSNWLAVPKDTKLTVLDIAGRAEEHFKAFCDDCREEIFLSIEGAFLHTLGGGKGKQRGNSKVGDTRAELFKWFLSAAVAHLLNDRERGLIPDIVDQNFAAVADLPRITLSAINEEELKASLDIDKGLQAMGWYLDIKEMEQRYGRKWCGPDQTELVPPQIQQQQMQMQQQLMGAMGAGGDLPGPPMQGAMPGAGTGAFDDLDFADDLDDMFGNSGAGTAPEKFAEHHWAWVPYNGPRGGKGWENTVTGNIHYGAHKPGSGEHIAEARGRGDSWQTLATYTGLPVTTLRNRHKAHRKQNYATPQAPESEPEPPAPPAPTPAPAPTPQSDQPPVGSWLDDDDLTPLIGNELVVDPNATPREQAAQLQQQADKTDYEFARESSIPNMGEDLKGSARHVRNAWRGLADAEASGTAEELVTRDNLLRNEPHNILATTTADNYSAALAMHLAMNKFPPAPFKAGHSYYDRQSEDVKRKYRENYVAAYQALKMTAEDLAERHTDATEAVKALAVAVHTTIAQIRKQGLPYDPVGNGLATMGNALKYGKTSVLRQVGEFSTKLKAAYGEAADPEKAADHAKDIMEGQSMNKTFGTVQGGKRGWTAADAYVKHAKRTGGPQLNVDTTAKGSRYVLDELKMRGLQWGNSVTDDERQHHLQSAAEAFADLTDILGLSPSMASFGGKLGLAIGARGKGNAMAHYEPDTKVINLTRTSGVGSLAHEWGHFFDDMTNGGRGRYASESGQMEEWRQASAPFRQRLAGVISKEIRDGNMSYRKAEYWRSTREVFARSFERHVQQKLRATGRENTYLAGVIPHELWPTDEEVAQMAPAFDAIFAKATTQQA